MTTTTIRRVRLCGKYHPRIKQDIDLPWLSLSGVWLRQAGFNIGDRLKITVEQNRLIIINEHHDDHQRD